MAKISDPAVDRSGRSADTLHYLLDRVTAHPNTTVINCFLRVGAAAAWHGVVPGTERITIDQINEAYGRIGEVSRCD